MGLAGRIAVRSLRGHPGRTMFSILGVAVGIATVVGVFTLDHVTVLSRTRQLQPGFGADLEVRPRADLSDPREELLAMEGVAGVAAFFQNDVGFRPEAWANEDTIRIRLVGLEADGARSLGVYHVEEGSDLSVATKDTGILIGRALAKRCELGVGDRVALRQPQRAAKNLCVDGEVQRVQRDKAPARERMFEVTGILSREGLGRRSGGIMIVADYNAGRELLQDVFVESQFWVQRSDAVDIESLESGLGGTFTFERNETKVVGQMADERAFRNGVRMAGLFALLLGLFVIFHTLSMSLIERVREVGNLHALGATRPQIARIFFVEALFIALLAGILGLGGGIGLAASLLGRGISTLGVSPYPVGPFEVPWDTVLPLAALGVTMALAGSVYPILRARSTDVVAALRGEGTHRRGARGFSIFSTLLLVAVVPAAFFQVVPIVGAAEAALVNSLLVGLIVLGLMIGLPLMAPSLFGVLTSWLAAPLQKPLPLVGKLVVRNVRESPTRIGASIAAIALVTAAFVGLKGMTNSLVGEIEVWSAQACTGKVWVKGLPDVPVTEVRDVLHELPEVVAVESGDARAFPSFLLFGMDAAELGKFGPLAEDPALVDRLLTENTMIVSDRLARQREIGAGDKVLIRTGGHGTQEFTVDLVSDAYGYFPHPDERAYAIVDARHVKRFFCIDTDTTSTVAVTLAGGDEDRILAVLEERFPGAKKLSIQAADPMLAGILADLEQDFVLFDIIFLLTALLAGLGVLNGQLLAALERKKELGVLRALGTTPGQIAGVVLVESILIGGVGGGLGLAVGTGLTPVLVSSLRVISGLALPMRTAGAFLAISLAGALVIALLAGLYPIWRMNRFDAVRAVRSG